MSDNLQFASYVCNHTAVSLQALFRETNEAKLQLFPTTDSGQIRLIFLPLLLSTV